MRSGRALEVRWITDSAVEDRGVNVEARDRCSVLRALVPVVLDSQDRSDRLVGELRFEFSEVPDIGLADRGSTDLELGSYPGVDARLTNVRLSPIIRPMPDVIQTVPDYELDPEVHADTPAKIRAVLEPTRSQILDLILERAASVTELANALSRPKSSVAHHVDVLLEAGLVRVVRTRKVRAMEERFYGRVGRTVVIAVSGAVSR